MPIPIQDLQVIATRADLAQLRQEIAVMLKELRLSIIKSNQSILSGNKNPNHSLREFGYLVGISRQTAMRWAQDGTIQASQEGGKGCIWLVPHSEVIRILKNHEDLVPQSPK